MFPMSRSDLSPTMRAAILEAMMPDGVLNGASRGTEYALIRRGLATEVRGRGTDRRGSTVYNAYRGARLNDYGKKIRAELLKAGES